MAIAALYLLLFGIFAGFAIGNAGIEATRRQLQKTADTVAIAHAQAACDASPGLTGAVLEEFSLNSDDGKPRIAATVKTLTSNRAAQEDDPSRGPPGIAVTVRLQQLIENARWALPGSNHFNLAVHAEARSVEEGAPCEISLAKEK